MPNLRQKLAALPLIQADIHTHLKRRPENTPIQTAAEALGLVQDAVDGFWLDVKCPRPAPWPYESLLNIGAACCASVRHLHHHGVLPYACEDAAIVLTSQSMTTVNSMHDGWGRLSLRMDLMREQTRMAMAGERNWLMEELREVLVLVFVIAADLGLKEVDDRTLVGYDPNRGEAVTVHVPSKAQRQGAAGGGMTQQALPIIEIGMRVRVDYSHPAIQPWMREIPIHAGKTGIVKSKSGFVEFEEWYPGGLVDVFLDADSRYPKGLYLHTAAAALVPIEPTFDDIVMHGLWLENRGPYSRYAYPPDSEESVWLHMDDERIADPDEDDRADAEDDDEEDGAE